MKLEENEEEEEGHFFQNDKLNFLSICLGFIPSKRESNNSLVYLFIYLYLGVKLSLRVS